MSEITNDFVYIPRHHPNWFPQHQSTWSTPPLTSASCQTAEREASVPANEERNSILRWVRENTRMNTTHCKHPTGHSIERLKLISAEEEEEEEEENEAMKLHVDLHDRHHNSTPHLEPKHHRSYFFNTHNYTTTTNRSAGNNSAFYHLACIGPEDPLVCSTGGPSSGRCNKEGRDYVKEEEEEEDGGADDDFVSEFLEAFKRVPEDTKFRARVYLKLCKDLTSDLQPVFLCPDDSKKFITLHDFSVYQYNNNNNNSKCCSNKTTCCSNNATCCSNSLTNAHNSCGSVDCCCNKKKGGESCCSKVFNIACNNNNNLLFDKTTYAKTYAFDRIFTPDEHVVEAYLESVSCVTKAVIGGHNGCIVCYGDPDYPPEVAGSDRGLARMSLRWLYACLEDLCHESLATYSVKLSACEFFTSGESMKDLLYDGGARSGERGEQLTPGDALTLVRVGSFVDVDAVLKKITRAKSDASSHTLLTIHLRQFHAKVPNRRKGAIFSNQLHIIDLSDKQGRVNRSAQYQPPPESSSAPSYRDGLVHFIGSLMGGQKPPVANTNSLHELLQSCILPASVQCQSCLILQLSQNKTPLRELQKLLGLGTKVYKRRFSRHKHLRSAQLFMRSHQSSASDTSSCTSSGVSSYRKSGVRMGVKQWQKNLTLDPTDRPKMGLSRELPLKPATARPNRLELEHKFGVHEHPLLPRVALPPSPFKGQWKNFSRPIQDTILESPEREKEWDKRGSRRAESNHFAQRAQETWVDGPASMVTNPYVNVYNQNMRADHKRSMENKKEDVLNFVSSAVVDSSDSHRRPPADPYGVGGSKSFDRTAGMPGQSFHGSISNITRTIQLQHSATTFQGMTSIQSQSAGYISKIHKTTSCGFQATNRFEQYDRPVQIPRQNVTRVEFPNEKHSNHSLIDRLPEFNSSVGQGSSNKRETSGCADKSSPHTGFRKISLPSHCSTQIERNKLMLAGDNRLFRDKFSNSSVYESWFEEKLEDASTNWLTDSFTANQPVPCATKTDSQAVQSNLTMSAEKKRKNSKVACEANVDRSGRSSSKSTKEKKSEFLKKFRRFFTRNPFKANSLSSSPCLVSKSQSHSKHPIKNKATKSPDFKPNSTNSGPTSDKAPRKFNSGLEQAPKKCFSFFARHKGCTKLDLIATAPATPNIYYDNQAAVNTITSTNSASVFNFSSLANKSQISECSGQKAFSSGRWHSLEAGGGATGSSDQIFAKDATSLSKEIASPKTPDFFKFVGEDVDDNRSQAESLVANVVCYRKIPFPKRGSDQSKPSASFLEPSYYRFSKLSSDGDFEKDQSSLENYSHDLNSNNSNNRDDNTVDRDDNCEDRFTDTLSFVSNTSEKVKDPERQIPDDSFIDIKSGVVCDDGASQNEGNSGSGSSDKDSAVGAMQGSTEDIRCTIDSSAKKRKVGFVLRGKLLIARKMKKKSSKKSVRQCSMQ